MRSGSILHASWIARKITGPPSDYILMSYVFQVVVAKKIIEPHSQNKKSSCFNLPGWIAHSHC